MRAVTGQRENLFKKHFVAFEKRKALASQLCASSAQWKSTVQDSSIQDHHYASEVKVANLNRSPAL
jgi:hypothetical protein